MNSITKTFILILILSSIVVNAQEIKIELKEEFVIGDVSETAPAEYIFKFPTNLTTDSQGNIYISDRDMSKIRVYNKAGEFITYIGNKGQGPGEMQEVTCMTVDPDDNLIVFDRWNQRFTRFIEMGKNCTTYPMPITTHIDAYKIFPLGDKKFVLYYRLKSKRKNWSFAENDDKILHIFSENFSTIEKSFADAGNIWDLEDSFFRAMVGGRFFSLFIIHPGKLILTPGFYEGNIARYELKNDEWQFRTLKGKIPKRGSYKLLNRSDYKSSKEYPTWWMSANGPGYSYLIQHRNMSQGLFALNDGSIVHFTRSLDRGEKTTTFGIELFNADGKYLGYCPISRDLHNNTENETYNHEVMWKDNKDQFYVHAFSAGYSIIRVMRLAVK